MYFSFIKLLTVVMYCRDYIVARNSYRLS